MTDRFLDAMSSRRASALSHVPVAAGLLEDGHARMKGWLEKERGFLGLRKKRFFILHKSQLYYFLEESEVAQGPGAAKGSYVISSCVLRALDASEVPKGTYGIGLIPPVTNHLTVLLCPSEEVRIEWLSALMAAGAREDETRNPDLMKARDKQKTEASAAANTAAAASSHSDGTRRSGGSVIFTMAPFPSHSTFADRMFPTSSQEGYLLKLGGLRKTSFQPRYFVLLGSQLIYFTHYNDLDSAKGTINLHQCGLEIETNAMELYGHEFVFYLLPTDKKKASLMSTLFGETLDRYALVAETAKLFEEWISGIRAEIERSATAAAAEAADGADERSDEEANSDDETSLSASSSASTKPGRQDTGASPFDQGSISAAKDHSVSSGSLGDLVSHLYKLDEEDYATALATDSNPHWSKRFYALDLKAHQLKVWKHKPTMMTLNKFKTIDLPPGTKVRIAKDDMVCSKTQKQRKFSPSVIAIHITTPPPGSILYLAPTSKSKFEEWYSVLLLALGKARAQTTTAQQRHQQQHQARESASQPANLQIPVHPVPSTNSASKPPRTPVKSQRSDSSASTPSMSQSQMLAEMGEALGDPDAMTHFRTRSVELHKGVITPVQYFKSYFRLFGKDRGTRFWRDLVHYVPREEIRDELRSLYKAHASLLDPMNIHGATSSSGSNPTTPNERRSSGRTSPAPSMLDPANSSFRLSNNTLASQLDPTPSFYPTAPSGMQSPMSPSSDEISPAAPEFPPPTMNKRHSSGGGGQHSQPQSPQNAAPSSSSYSFSKSNLAGGGKSTTTAASSPTSSTLPTTESFSNNSSISASNSFTTSNSFNSSSQNPTVVVGSVDPAILREALTHSVENWRVRCENHIITLLCTLHEILPELVSSGQFIPPMDSGFPTLREVKQTFNKAVVVIHPDKNKTHKSKKVQILTELVFQCLQQAFEKHEKMEKKKEKKAAAAAGGSS